MNARFALKAALVALVLLSLGVASLRAQGSEYYFPHVADGALTGVFYSTSFLLSNPANSGTSITFRFVRSDGSPWVIDLQSLDRPDITGRRSTVTFTLQPRETVELFTGGVDPFAVGWSRAESDLPIEISEAFQLININPPFVRSEASVLPSSPGTQFSFYATVSTGEPVLGTNIDTGLALANPSNSSAQVTFRLFSRVGTQISQKVVNLPANRHTAMFVSQIFDTVSFSDLFHGAVRFSSNVNIAVVGLRQTFGNSDTISTLPINPDSILGYGPIYDREPNDTTASAQRINDFPVEIIGTLNSPGDAGDLDMFSMNLRSGEVLFVAVVAELINSPLDSIVRIRNSSGAVVATADEVFTGLRDPFIRFVVPSTGTYFIDHGAVGNTSSRSSHYRIHVLVK